MIDQKSNGPVAAEEPCPRKEVEEVLDVRVVVERLHNQVEPHLPPGDPLRVVLEAALRATDWLGEVDYDGPVQLNRQACVAALRHLLTAKAAYEGQPEPLRREWLNGWPPGGPTPDREKVLADLRGPVERVLTISSSSAGKVWEMDFVLWQYHGDVTVQILEGTTKQEALAQLRNLLEGLESGWDRHLDENEIPF